MIMNGTPGSAFICHARVVTISVLLSSVVAVLVITYSLRILQPTVRSGSAARRTPRHAANARILPLGVLSMSRKRLEGIV